MRFIQIKKNSQIIVCYVINVIDLVKYCNSVFVSSNINKIKTKLKNIYNDKIQY